MGLIGDSILPKVPSLSLFCFLCPMKWTVPSPTCSFYLHYVLMKCNHGWVTLKLRSNQIFALSHWLQSLFSPYTKRSNSEMIFSSNDILSDIPPNSLYSSSFFLIYWILFLPKYTYFSIDFISNSFLLITFWIWTVLVFSYLYFSK